MVRTADSSSAFSPASLLFRSLLFLLLAAPGATVVAAAAVPDYVHLALRQFSTEPPPGWAYILETTKDDSTMVERFDPAAPPAERWTLRRFDGREPTAAEREKYARSRTLSGPGGPQPPFQKADLEPASLDLVREDADRAEVRGGFREVATGADKMLRHLMVRFLIVRHPLHIARCTVELREPYSPVLGVRMRELRVETDYDPPADGHPARPRSVVSHFLGRIFFFPTSEDFRLTYRDYSPARPPADPQSR
jgi:hypothetical protein